MALKYLTLRLEQVVPNQNWQTRSKLNENNVERLMQRMQDGVTLPPILVYQVGDRYEIVDGFRNMMARLGALEPTEL